MKILILAAILDIIFTWKARCTVDPNQTLKHVLRVVVAMMWTIILPIYYASSRRKYTCYSTQSGSWLGEWCYSSYMVAVAFYLMTNAIDMVLFFVPVVGKYIETSNYRICMFLSWWTQVNLQCPGPSLHKCIGAMQSKILNILGLQYILFIIVCPATASFDFSACLGLIHECFLESTRYLSLTAYQLPTIWADKSPDCKRNLKNKIEVTIKNIQSSHLMLTKS